MPSLSPAPADHQADAPFPLASEYPFSTWSDLGDRPGLHPELLRLWNTVKYQFWLKGHPAAGALFEAIHRMSRCASFRMEAQR